MALDELLVFRTDSGSIGLKKWLEELKKTEHKAYVKCLESINFLYEFGDQPWVLKMPRAKILRDNIWELRAKSGKVRYRILFFFCGDSDKKVACLSHGFKKGGKGASESPYDEEIEIAIKRRTLVIKERNRHTEDWEEQE